MQFEVTKETMERRTFIKSAGIFIGVASFTSCSSITDSSAEEDLLKRDEYSHFSTPIHQAIAIGLNAPSSHNTQAWKFKILNEAEMMLYVDEKRLLPETDPPARQIHISCGCFLEALSIGCSGIGYTANISLLPEGNYEIAEIGKKPVAHIKLTKNNEQKKHPFFDYIFERRTNRKTYNGELISDSEFSKIIAECQNKSSKVIFINKTNDIENYKTIFSRAMEIESYTLATNEETRRMFRFNNHEATTQRDGLTFESSGLSGVEVFLAKNFAKNTTESWNDKETIKKGLTNFNHGLNSSKAFVLWTTSTNNLLDQIKTGQDFYQFSLALLKNGMYLHPLNQANQEYKEMSGISRELDQLVGIKNQEKIQMIIRIGRAKIPYKSYRRKLDSFLI
jgi:hypothetical protein